MFTFENVKCCGCHGRGKTRFLRRTCKVCDGAGEREIILPAKADPATKYRLRLGATLGIWL